MERKGRVLYAQAGLAQIPHILGMVDRHRLSPTYGCFDRSYWHYRTAPFPSGMYEEFVLPLALVYRFPFPGGENYFEQPRLRELVVAGMKFGAKACHPDGSCDDYFPFERALGAAAFSLYAMTESALLLDIRDGQVLEFLKKRAQWLASAKESGKLSNHQALVVLALFNTFLVTGEERLKEASARRLKELLAWQSPEGWFPEYQGCDPGYLTATIDFLAKYHLKSMDTAILEPLDKAIGFVENFVHPDGTCGGEYGSRNTYLFFPHGFELASRWNHVARRISSRYLKGLEKGNRVYLDDDRLCAHLTYNHLQAYLDFSPHQESPCETQPRAVAQENYFADSGLFVLRDPRRHLVVSVTKGGVVTLYKEGSLVYSDSGLVARLSDGRVIVSHLVDRYQVWLERGHLSIEGSFGISKFRLPTPYTQALFHVGMCTLGRLGSDLVRRILQRMLIVGKRKHPVRFRRTFLFGEQVKVVDEIWNPLNPKVKVVELWAGTDHTSIYVAMSRCYRPTCLLPWVDYSCVLESLERQGYGRVERILG